MMESVVLLSNEVALPGTFGCGVISSEKDLHRVLESSWKVISQYQQASDTCRSPSFPPVVCIKLQHLFCECVNSGMMNCRLIDEGDVLKDVLEDYNLLVTDVKLAVIVRLLETKLVFTDFKMSSAGDDLEFLSPDQAVGIVLSQEVLASTPENIRTTVTISIPISSSRSTLTQSEPQSVFEEVFRIDHIMDRIITYVVGLNAGPRNARDIKSVTAVNKCWRASYCRVLESYGTFIRTITPDILNETIKSFSGGFPLHDVIPYHLEMEINGNPKFSGRFLRFLARYPATALTCCYQKTLMEELHHIVQFHRLKTLCVDARFNRDILQDVQRMLTNSPILRRFEIVGNAGIWIPSRNEGLILPESLKFLQMYVPLFMVTVVSDQNQFKNLKHLRLNLDHKYRKYDDGLEEFFEMEEDFLNEEGDDADDVQFHVEVDDNGQPDGADEINAGQNQHVNDHREDILDEDRINHISMLELSAAQINVMLKTMGPSLVSLDLLAKDGPLIDFRVSLPDLPKLNRLVVNWSQVDAPTSLPSLETIYFNRDPMELGSKLFTEGRKFEWVTELLISDGIKAASISKIASALPNCSKLSVFVDYAKDSGHDDSAATLGEIFFRLPRLLFLELAAETEDIHFLDFVFTGLSIQEITRLKQTDESWDNVILGPRSIKNLNYLRTLVLGLNGKPGIEVSDFLFRVAFMKIDTLTNIELNNRLSAGGAIMQQWKSMGRELRKSCNTD